MQNPLELSSSYYVLSETIEIQEKLTNSQSFESDLSLNLLQDLLDWLSSVRQSLLDIEFFGQGVFVQI